MFLRGTQLLILSVFTVAAVNCFANNTCETALVLLNKITTYSCPEVDIPLSGLLTNDANDTQFVNKVCSVNSTSCLSGVYSFVNEANGLATITKNNNSSYCYIAEEDQGQLGWYLTNYILLQCDNHPSK